MRGNVIQISCGLLIWVLQEKNREGKKKKEKTSQLYIYPETTKFKLESILGHFSAHRKTIVEQNCSSVLLL